MLFSDVSRNQDFEKSMGYLGEVLISIEFPIDGGEMILDFCQTSFQIGDDDIVVTVS